MVEQVAVNDKVVGSSPTGTAKVVYASGQRMWTVNPSSFEFVGSNPTATTYLTRKKVK